MQKGQRRRLCLLPLCLKTFFLLIVCAHLRGFDIGGSDVEVQVTVAPAEKIIYGSGQGSSEMWGNLSWLKAGPGEPRSKTMTQAGEKVEDNTFQFNGQLCYPQLIFSYSLNPSAGTCCEQTTNR